MLQQLRKHQWPASLAALGAVLLLAGCGGGRGDVNWKRGSSEPVIRFEDSPEDGRFGSVIVTGLPPHALAKLREEEPADYMWSELFSVRVGSDPVDAEKMPPVMGRYAIEEEGIRFIPRFPLAAGLDYSGRFEGCLFDSLVDAPFAGTPDAEITFTVPEPDRQPTTRVAAVYPTAAVLPANQLRLYVHFTAPMRPQNVHRYVRLYDAAGRDVGLPFVEIEHGLWDPDYRRLTLFFHPGRIKRGVAPNRRLGPPLEEGGRYRLVIDPAMRDAMGYPLAAGFTKEFRVGPADRSSPDYRAWRVTAPSTGDEPLVVEFPEPLDHALLRRYIAVRDAAGRVVAGEISISKHETRWSFAPAAPWKSGGYTISVNPAIEDMAGNTLEHLFDSETGLPGERAPDAGEPFEIAFSL